MGIYTEYLDRRLDGSALNAERKKQLRRISELRGGRDLFVIGGDLNNESNLASISYGDLLPINDQLANLNGTKLDLILETPGGSGEVAEDIVHSLRDKYDEIAVIVPGWAKSAGTIMAMAADEILMEPASALGPIDAQISRQGKVFSADALLMGLEKIKSEVEKVGNLNRAYIPILQGISPGELQHAENALQFARRLVTDWLKQYKFSRWEHHSSTGKAVTEKEREQRANEIASKLCNHSLWLTHGRSIKIGNLRDMRLLITDYAENKDLADAIRRYYALLRMLFETNVYKVFETTSSQIYRFNIQAAVPLPQPNRNADVATVDITCNKCKSLIRIQANLDKPAPLQEGTTPFPKNNKTKCPACGVELDLTDLRRQIELQSKKRVV